MAKHIALIIALSVAGCTEQRTSMVTDDSRVDDIQADDSGESKSDGGQPDAGYSYQYCEGRQVLTGVCSEGICDPAPFETCDDGSCVLSPASCNKKPPPPLPEMIDVTIKNERAESIYIDGLFVPFTLRDSDGEEIATHQSLNISSCEKCNDICDNNIHGDPAPCYVEIAAGAEVTLSWDAMTYWNETCAPICDKSCSKSAPLAPGDYTIVIPYRLELDPGYDFTEAATCWSSVQGGTGWRGNGIGTCSFSHEAELVVSYSEQDALLLSID